jgi:hypothetical protein
MTLKQAVLTPLLGAFCGILNTENFQSAPLPDPDRYRAKERPPPGYQGTWGGFWRRMCSAGDWVAFGLGRQKTGGRHDERIPDPNFPDEPIFLRRHARPGAETHTQAQPLLTEGSNTKSAQESTTSGALSMASQWPQPLPVVCF